MFCSECGVKASGKFCWSCGQPLQQHGSQPAAFDEEVELTPVGNWQEWTDCRALVAVPEIRERIARHTAMAKSKFSGEDFLECCDKLLSPLTGGVPLTIVAKIAQPISEKLGFKTGKDRCERMAEKPGVVIVAILCSLAQNGQTLRHVTQLPAGCTLQAALPSEFGLSRATW